MKEIKNLKKITKEIELAKRIIDIATMYFEVDIRNISAKNKYAIPRKITIYAIIQNTQINKATLGRLIQPTKKIKSKTEGSLIFKSINRIEFLLGENQQVQDDYMNLVDLVLDEIDLFNEEQKIKDKIIQDINKMNLKELKWKELQVGKRNSLKNTF